MNRDFEVPNTAVCIRCGYRLFGLPGTTCPECGRAFDPSHPATYRDTARKDLLWRYRRPQQVWSLWLISILTAVVLFDASSPGQLFGLACIQLPLMAIVLLIVCGDYGIRLWLYASASADTRRKSGRANRLRWLVPTICLLILASIFAYPWPAFIRFWASKSAFDKVAAAPTPSSTWQRIGLFVVRRVTVHTGGEIFLDTGDGVLDEYGFMFCPGGGTPTDVAEFVPLARLSHGWWVVEQTW